MGDLQVQLEQADVARIKLVGEASTLTGKRYVSETIVVIIDRTGEHIMPYLPTLARAIPGLCELMRNETWTKLTFRARSDWS